MPCPRKIFLPSQLLAVAGACSYPTPPMQLSPSHALYLDALPHCCQCLSCHQKRDCQPWPPWVTEVVRHTLPIQVGAGAEMGACTGPQPWPGPMHNRCLLPHGAHTLHMQATECGRKRKGGEGGGKGEGGRGERGRGGAPQRPRPSKHDLVISGASRGQIEPRLKLETPLIESNRMAPVRARNNAAPPLFSRNWP